MLPLQGSCPFIILIWMFTNTQKAVHETCLSLNNIILQIYWSLKLELNNIYCHKLFFINLSLMEFQVRYLVLFLLFSVIGSFGWFWMGNFHKNIQLMLEFLKGLFLVLHFSYYTLVTFLTMLYVILLSMLMILLSTLNVIRHVICGSN